MVEVRQTENYEKWFDGLRDREARTRIDIRIRRLSLGNLGDVKPVGEGVSEIRIDYGSGYRVYFVQRGLDLVILLGGGDKSTQARDIAQPWRWRAKFRRKTWRNLELVPGTQPNI